MRASGSPPWPALWPRTRVAGASSVIWAACSPGGGAPAYWPWTQLLREVEEVIRASRADAAAPRERDSLEHTHGGGSAARAVRRGRSGAGGADARPAGSGRTRRPALGGRTVPRPPRLRRSPTGRQIDARGRHLSRPGSACGAPPDRQRGGGAHAGGSGRRPRWLDWSQRSPVSRRAPGNAEEIRDRTGGNPLFIRELSRLMVARGYGRLIRGRTCPPRWPRRSGTGSAS